MSIGDELVRNVRLAADAALLEAGHLVLEEAKRNVPVGDPGLDPDAHIKLRESGKVEIVRSPFGDHVRVEFDTPYAAKQEFDTRLKHPRGGGAHYLERAVTTIAPTLTRLVAAKVDAKTATGLISDPGRRRGR